jgi:Kdo2-lipid IVA lauroyltransferase/acyltransferase
MYYLVYGLFYLLSLLPYRVMYLLSDGVYFLLYYVIRYRKEMVLNHLAQTFPEKSPEEREMIAKRFFRNFTDVWVEMIKIFSMSEAEAAKRMKVDFSLAEEWFAKGKSIQIVGGHFMNWEYLPVAVPLFQSYTAIAIYMPLSNGVLDRVVYRLRSRFGLVLLRAGNMQEEIKPWINKQYMMIVGADQSPSNPDSSYWLNFCNKPTGFIKGPWIRAVRQGQPYIYMTIRKPKRGHYEFKMFPFADDPAAFSPEELALKYANTLEDDIRQMPDLYLWTHNRWKKPWKPEYTSKWVDTLPPPAN